MQLLARPTTTVVKLEAAANDGHATGGALVSAWYRQKAFQVSIWPGKSTPCHESPFSAGPDIPALPRMHPVKKRKKLLKW
jgi:hypothetical protein